jgi:hypothetical protein
MLQLTSQVFCTYFVINNNNNFELKIFKNLFDILLQSDIWGHLSVETA